MQLMARKRPLALTEGASMSQYLRCCAEGRPGHWEAFCLDFDLAVQGESLPEVIESLSTAIALYLERVTELPAVERGRFLRRRAPFAGFKFLWRALLISLLRHSSRDGKTWAEFIVPYTA
jgi:hypothetical protein